LGQQDKPGNDDQVSNFFRRWNFERRGSGGSDAQPPPFFLTY